MACKSKKLKDNVDGAFYVDDQCISCGACLGEAPDFFDLNDAGAFVKKQPMTAEEKAKCDAAKNVCPVDAIGSDGEE